MLSPHGAEAADHPAATKIVATPALCTIAAGG
jgi:hypothetical protein